MIDAIPRPELLAHRLYVLWMLPADLIPMMLIKELPHGIKLAERTIRTASNDVFYVVRILFLESKH
jgi:hypothetical protein